MGPCVDVDRAMPKTGCMGGSEGRGKFLKAPSQGQWRLESGRLTQRIEWLCTWHGHVKYTIGVLQFQHRLGRRITLL